jgi:molybdopterin-containing oxidoreductase family membrane subunit
VVEQSWQRFEEVSLVLAVSYASCSFGTYYCIDGFCYLCNTWMAHYYIPPYFVAGAVFSGFAMVNTLLIIMRKVSKLEAYITIQHIELMNIVIMITGSIVGVAIRSYLSLGILVLNMSSMLS